MIETERKVHPAAAVFPRLSEDELRELADDIKANGLLHPIVLDSEGRIVDGINRDIACDMAGAEKQYITLPPEADIFAYILSQNVRRRHMSKGQQAMAIAAMVETEEGRRDGQQKRLIVESTISQAYVTHAVTIRRYAADLAPGVLANTEPFDRAYTVAVARKREQEERGEAAEKQARQDAIELERLRRVAPEIAADVPGKLSVAEAKTLYASREAAARERRVSMASSAERAYLFFDPGSRATPAERAAEIAADLDASVIPTRPDFSSERTERIGQTVLQLAALLRAKEGRTNGHAPRRRDD